MYNLVLLISNHGIGLTELVMYGHLEQFDGYHLLLGHGAVLNVGCVGVLGLRLKLRRVHDEWLGLFHERLLGCLVLLYKQHLLCIVLLSLLDRDERVLRLR